ncbi:MAG: glycosyltransferase [Planctomycetota bacterium]
MVFDAEGTGLDIGFLCNGWTPDLGGVETHCQGLAGELMARGHRVHVLCLDTREGLEPYTVAETEVGGVAVRRMAYRYHDHRALADLVESPRADDVIHAWLAEVPVDLVHVHHATGFGLSALRAIADVGRPLAVTLHDYWSLCPRGQMLRTDGEVCREATPSRCAPCLAETWPHLMPSGAGERRGPGGAPVEDDAAAAEQRTRFAHEMLGLAQRVFTPSAAARDVFVRAGLDAARVRVVENGVDVGTLAKRTASLRSAREPDDGELRLGVLGTVLPSKGALELARALLAANAPHLVLEIHGNLPSYHGDESYIAELRALSEREPRVRVMGAFEHAQLPAILARLDGVAAPSRWAEVFGLTVREARAAGLPVLVSDAGDLPSVAAGGAAGIVVGADDRAGWIAALERFHDDAEARAAWGAFAAEPRTNGELALELEHAYAELVLEGTGALPRFAYPIAGIATRRTPAGSPKRSLFGRLFGGRS